MSAAAEMMSAAAAKISGSMQRQEDEPAIAMAKTLESLRTNPVSVLAGKDDRCHELHPGRFLGGAVCSAKKMWLEARSVIGLDGIPPLSNYDLASVGLGGCVTMRGFKEIHNPASPHLTLKLFSSTNMGSSTTSTKRLTLADGDRSVNVGDNLREINDLLEFKLAVRALCRTGQFVMSWNMSFNCIDGFLNTTNYAYAELNGRTNRASILTDFVNYVLGLNAAAWVQKEPFLNSGEIKVVWSEWFGSRPASLLVSSNNNGGGGGGAGGGVFSSRPAIRNSSMGRSGNRGGRAGRGGRGSRGGQSAGSSTHSVGAFTMPPPSTNRGSLCRRWNFGNCPNQAAASCTISGGLILQHRCNAIASNGNTCNNQGHIGIHHR
jgi:hypothetical protein